MPSSISASKRKSRLSSLLLAVGYFEPGPALQRFQPARRPVRGERRPAAIPGPLAAALRRRDAGARPGRQRAAAAAACLPRTGAIPRKPMTRTRDPGWPGSPGQGRALNLKFSWLHEGRSCGRRSRTPARTCRISTARDFFPLKNRGEFRADTLALAADGKFAFSWLGKNVEIEPFLDLSLCPSSAPRKDRDAQRDLFCRPALPGLSVAGRRRATAISGARPRPGPCSSMELGRGHRPSRPAVPAVPGARISDGAQQRQFPAAGRRGRPPLSGPARRTERLPFLWHPALRDGRRRQRFSGETGAPAPTIYYWT